MRVSPNTMFSGYLHTDLDPLQANWSTLHDRNSIFHYIVIYGLLYHALIRGGIVSSQPRFLPPSLWRTR